MWMWAAGDHERAREKAIMMSRSDKLSKEEKLDKIDSDDCDKLSKLRAGVGTMMLLDTKEKNDVEVHSSSTQSHVYTLTHTLTHSLTHSLIAHSLIHCTHSLTHSYTLTHSPGHHVRWDTHSLSTGNESGVLTSVSLISYTHQ